MPNRSKQKSRFILWGRWFHRDQVVRSMEVFQDIIVICLCLSLLAVMLMQLWDMAQAILHPIDLKKVTADVLYLLILVELFRLLILYLEEHSISVGVAVEVAIVSVLREVVVHGAFEFTWTQLASVCGLLFVLGGLLMVCARTPHMDQQSHHQSGLHGPQHGPQHGSSASHSTSSVVHYRRDHAEPDDLRL